MKILVTGANGQLGRELFDLQSKLQGYAWRFTDVDSLDLTDFASFENFMTDFSPGFVINCAAYTAVDQAENNHAAAYLLNSEAPAFLADMCRKYNAKFIHISTDYVFDGESSIPYNEENTPNPQSVYGASKFKGETKVVENNHDSLIIRTSWLYSTYGSNFVKTLLRLGSEREELSVVFDQIGTPTYAHDLAAVIIEIIRQSTFNGKWVPGIYHFSNEGVCSWFDFAVAIHQIANISCRVKPIESKDFPTLAKRPSYSVLNKAKIKSTYGFEIPYWRDSLKMCIQKILNSKI